MPAPELLGYLTAIIRVYNAHGRRNNIHKARIKILVESLGIDAFRAEVEAEYAVMDRVALVPPAEEVARIASYFAPPLLPVQAERSAAFEQAKADDRGFARWARNNLRPHKQAGYASAVISLKPLGGVPGDATADQMDALADIAERFGGDDIRVAYEQNLVLPHVALDDATELYAALKAAGLDAANADLATDIIACPGLDYCSLANARSIPVAQAISARLADLDLQEAIGPVRINISGCINACGHHHVGHIGVLGVDKQGEEFYQLTVGGSPDEQAALGEIVGKGLPSDAVAPAIERVLRHYLQLRQSGELFIDTVRRVGAEPFKGAIYADA